LLVAVKTQTPPGGKLLARVNPLPFGMNAHIITVDDDVEILFSPSMSTKGDAGKIYQMIVNGRGALWQQKFKSRGTPLHAWHGHWQIVSNVVGNRWELRAAIPWKDFGIKHIEGKTVGIRIGRDWMQRGPHLPWQTQWAPQGGGYGSINTMPRVTFDSAAPVVQVRQLQDRPNSPADLKLSMFNPGSRPIRLRAVVDMVPQEDKATLKTQVLTLGAGQTKLLAVPSVAVAGEPLYTRIKVSSVHGKTTFYSREFSWEINRPIRLWSLNHGASKRIDTAFMYYPSINTLEVRVNLSDLANRQEVTGVKLQVRDQKTGAIVASTTMPAVRKAVTRLREWKIPPLNGKYDLMVELQGIKAKPEVLPFVRYHFKWEHNELGRDNKIIVPPFKAITVAGQTVGVVLRRIGMNGLGLWGQVEAAGQKLLSGPMRIVVRAGGKRFVGHGILHFTEVKPTRVVAVADWQAGPLKGNSRSVWDYDGMMKTTLRLEPTQEKLDSVVLVIPMVNKEMPLMTACTDGVRFNYSGQVPGGVGEVWNGSEAPRNSIIGSFVPYIWTGGPVRGIAAFGDNDAGWVDYQAKRPCQELVREGDGTLELRMNLVAKPARLRTVHTIVLGFQATPIKPMPKNWRLWTENAGVAGAIHTVFAGACIYWGCRTAFGDIYPRGHDFSIYKQFEMARRTGKINWAFVKQWLAGYAGVTPTIAAHRYGPAINGMFSSMAGHPQEVVTYTNPAAMRVDTRAGRTYLNEWDRHVYPTRQYYRGEYFDGTVNPCRSFRDFAEWYYQKMLSTFDDGIYWDNMFLKSDFNTVLTNAYRLPDGYVQPATTLWTQRALVRRTAVLDAQLHKPDLNMVHMTNSAIAPELSFARIDLDLEDKYGSSPFQTRFSRAFLLTEIAGRQFGNIPLGLAGFNGSTPRQLVWAQRTYAGVALTMEIRGWDSAGSCYFRNYGRLVKFGYGTRVTKTWDYWRRDYPMRVYGDKTSSIVVAKRKGGQAVVVVCDWGHGGTIRLRLNRTALHLPGHLSVINMGTKKTVRVTAGGEIVFHLKKFDFKMLLVNAAGAEAGH
jgi:hypothetical protein